MQINFIWKFSRDQSAHEKELSAKKQLVEKFIFQHSNSCDIEQVSLYPVERLGLGGSKVFYLDISFRDGPNERCVAKFNSVFKTNRECLSAYKAVRFRLCGEVYSSHKEEAASPNALTDEFGLLVYKFAKLSHSRAVEFREFYLDNKYANEKCVEVLEKLYNGTIHLAPDEMLSGKKVNLIESYEWYYNRSTSPLNKFSQLVLVGEHSEFSAKAKRILAFHNSLISDHNYCSLFVLAMFQHGDLHARNILLDPDNLSIQPDLIDFDWADFDAHAGRDFTVLETTVKFMLIQEFSLRNYNDNRKHVSPLFYIQLEKALCEYGLDLPTDPQQLFQDLGVDGNESILRAYECIRVIRKNAKRFLAASFKEDRPTDFSIEKEYFVALFLVSIGHIAFDTSDDYWVLNGCDLLVSKIQSMD